MIEFCNLTRSFYHQPGLYFSASPKVIFYGTVASPAIVTQSTSTLDGASAVYGLSTAFVVAEDLRDPTICRLQAC